MTADPHAPKVGDRFVRKPGSAYPVEVRFVDDDGSVTYRYQDRSSWVDDAETFAHTFVPPEPLIAEPLTLYRGPESGIWYRDTGVAYVDHWPTITILPDGTWHEGRS